MLLLSLTTALDLQLSLAYDHRRQPTTIPTLFLLAEGAMANAYIFTLQPTFTQGLLLGQLSILCLLVFILKSLFFDTTDSGQPYKPVSYHPRVVTAEDGDESSDSIESIKLPPDVLSRSSQGSMDWLNVILQEVSHERLWMREDGVDLATL